MFYSESNIHNKNIPDAIDANDVNPDHHWPKLGNGRGCVPDKPHDMVLRPASQDPKIFQVSVRTRREEAWELAVRSGDGAAAIRRGHHMDPVWLREAPSNTEVKVLAFVYRLTNLCILPCHN